jgi:hypothetical protein
MQALPPVLHAIARDPSFLYITVLAFYVTWSRALAWLQAVWSGRTRYLYTNRTL